MRLRVSIPRIEPSVMIFAAACPYDDCDGRHFKMHQLSCDKPARDIKYDQVNAMRRECLRCGRTHRVYPQGVSEAHHSDRLKGLSVLLYLLGLSYGAVEDLLTALESFLSKTTVWRNVQAAGEKVR
jgi:ribosomal protein S27AE